MRKGQEAIIPIGLLVLGVIGVFILGTVVAVKWSSAVEAPEALAHRFSHSGARYINELSSMEKGHVKLKLDGKFDVEIKKESGGYRLVFTPYDSKGKKGDSEAAAILSYPVTRSFEKVFVKPESICITKAPSKSLAEVAAC
jgi:hypothetical protein